MCIKSVACIDTGVSMNSFVHNKVNLIMKKILSIALMFCVGSLVGCTQPKATTPTQPSKKPDTSAVVPGDKPADKPADKTGEKAGEKTGNKTGEKTNPK